MLAQSIPLASFRTIFGLLTISLRLESAPKALPAAADIKLLDSPQITFAERRVLKHISQPAKIIADRLNLSIHTVKKHIRNLFKKTNCSNSKELAEWAQRNQITNLYLNE